MTQNLNIFFYKLILRLKTKIYFNNLIKWSRSNLKKSHFIISFDFETQRDINVISKLTEKLVKINIVPFYAIPGELILKNLSLIKKLSKTITFINHGFKIHTKYCTKSKINFSSYSYVNKPKDEIFDDIKKADIVLKKHLKKESNIFRTPHFGEFCEKNNMNLIYKIVSKLGYKVSLSTSPIYSLINYPIYYKKNIMEIPCNAYIKNPRQIIDSWSLNNGNLKMIDMVNELEKYFQNMSINNLLLNTYFDPSDIVNENSFFSVMAKLSKYQVKRIENIQ